MEEINQTFRANELALCWMGKQSSTAITKGFHRLIKSQQIALTCRLNKKFFDGNKFN